MPDFSRPRGGSALGNCVTGRLRSNRRRVGVADELRGWHRVLMNTESDAPAMRHVVFLD